MSQSFDQLSKQELRNVIQEILDKKNRVSHKQWVDIIRDYDLDCSPDSIRKIASGIIYAEYAGMQFNDDDQYLVDRNFIERQKLYDVQRKVNNDLRQMSRTELICESITKAIKSLPKIELPIPRETRRAANRKRDLVVGIADFHYGAKFDVLGLYNESMNKYDSSVFVDRMNALLCEITDIVDKDNPGQVTIMIAGDMLDGLLRTSQLQRLEYGVIESAMRLSEILTSWLVELEVAINIPIRVYAVRGNHGEIRPLGTKAGQFPEENMERVVMHYLYARFSGVKNINIAVNDAPMMQVVDVCGYKFLLMHGQGGNIESVAKNSVNLYQKPIDVFMVGHLHKNQTFSSGVMPNSNVLVERVPSICGIDPYAQNKGYGALPGATVILMEEGYGRRCVYPITLK